MKDRVKPGPVKPDMMKTHDLPGLNLDEAARSIPVVNLPITEVAVKDLPLFIVITNIVLTTELPQKEFLSTGEFEEYVEEYAQNKFQNPVQREKFVKRQTNNALFLDDEIKGNRAWQQKGEVIFPNARKCGFGILKTQSKQFYMFQTSMGMDLPSQLAAYQALTYRTIGLKHLPLFASREDRSRLKFNLGAEIYLEVLQALGIAGLIRE